MADFKPKPGSFLPYLEYSKQNRNVQPSAGQRGSPLALLEILARQQQRSLPIFDLQSLSALEPSRFADALKMLSGEGYVQFTGEAPDQMVQLTDQGLAVAKLSRSA